MTSSRSPFESLSFEAPYLIEKLLKEHIVDSAEEGQALFREVKRFIIMVRADDTVLWDMHSLRIDEVWHQFVLFTAEYIEFSLRYFGVYIQHSPSNAPEPVGEDAGPPRRTATFAEFEQRYAELFGEPLPGLWYDETHVKPHRRILNDHVGSIVQADADGLSHLCNADGEVLLSVNRLARDAMRFICATPAFYVRELPGDLDDEEKVALVGALVEYKLLRVGS